MFFVQVLTGARGRNRTGRGVSSRGILSPLRLPISPPGRLVCQEGWGRDRTGVHGFAGRCITTLPPSQKRRLLGGKNNLSRDLQLPYLLIICNKSDEILLCKQFCLMERETRLELATSTLARLRSTN